MMADLQTDFIVDHFDALIAQGRAEMHWSLEAHKRSHSGHRLGACPDLRRDWNLISGARFLRSQIVRTSGWKPRLAA